MNIEFLEKNPTEQEVVKWIQKKKNILVSGRPGIGKTSIFVKGLEKALGYKDENGTFHKGIMGKDFLYFSCPTLDTYVDFSGIPKEAETVIDGKTYKYVDIVRPKNFVFNNVRAIILDEYNRSNRSTRNATMEIIQFRTLNGNPFPDLTSIIATANIEEENDKMSYDVEPIDDGQIDRFHIRIKMPYKPNREYFTAKYGKKIADSAISYWESLGSEDLKLKVTPRRLEMAIEAYRDDIDLDLIIPIGCNPSALLHAISNGIPEDTLREFLSNNNKEGARKFLSHDSNFNSIKPLILNLDESELRHFILPLIEQEKLTSIISNSADIRNEIKSKSTNVPEYMEIIKILSKSSPNARFRKEMSDFLDSLNQVSSNEPIIISDTNHVITDSYRNILEQDILIDSPISLNKYNPAKLEPLGKDVDTEILAISELQKQSTNSFFRREMIDRLSNLLGSKDCISMSESQMSKCISFLEFFAQKTGVKLLLNTAGFIISFNSVVIYLINSRYTKSNIINILPNCMNKCFNESYEYTDEDKNNLKRLVISRSQSPKINKVVEEEDFEASLSNMKL